MLKAKNGARAEIGDEHHQAVAFQTTVQTGVVDVNDVEDWLPDEETLRLDLKTAASLTMVACHTALTTRVGGARSARVRLKLEVTPIFEQ